MIYYSCYQMIAIFQMLSVNPYLLLAICYLLSYTFYVKLAFTCKNLFPFARCCTSRNFLIKKCLYLFVSQNFSFVKIFFGCNVFGSPFNKSIDHSLHLNKNLVTFLNNSIDKIIVDVHFISDKKNLKLISQWLPSNKTGRKHTFFSA